MSKRVDARNLTTGDKVRVGRERDDNGEALHGIKFGAVCTVVDLDVGDSTGCEVGVRGPLKQDGEPWTAIQWVSIKSLKQVKA